LRLASLPKGHFVESDWEAIGQDAVAVLRVALVCGLDISGALRRCWYQNLMFGIAVFIEAVRMRFQVGCDIRLLTAFIARHWPVGGSRGPAFPAREAEALMRFALGEASFVDEVDPARFNYPEICISLLEALFQDWQPGADEVAELVARAEAAVAAGHDIWPEIRDAEDAWLAMGMHESPFASWSDDQDDRPSPEK
jgi:hypothetical protein